MSGPVEVPEVERLREQVRRLEEREAGLSTLLESYGQQIERLRADLDAELMERAAARVRARHDMLRFEALKRAAAEHLANLQRMCATVQQANTAVERLESEALRLQRQIDERDAEDRTLRVCALVQAIVPEGEDTRQGIVVAGPAPKTKTWLVWWCDEQDADAGTALWERPERLTVIG